MTFDPAEIETLALDPDAWRKRLIANICRTAVAVEKAEKLQPGGLVHALALAAYQRACDELEESGWAAVWERHQTGAPLQ